MKHIEIDKEKYYKPSEVIEFHPILKVRGLQYLYSYRRNFDKDLFINTAPKGKRPSLLIKGDKLAEFIKAFDKSLQ